MKKQINTKKIFAQIIFASLSSFFLLAFVHHRKAEKTITKYFLGGEYSVGDVDDPNARIEFEKAMLADPATGEIPKGIRQRELEFASTLPVVAGLKSSRATLSWINRGPWNVGGRTRGLAM